MSKLYVVVQVSPKRHCDYKNGWIREETSVGVPYVLSDYEEAHKRAKEKQDARVPAFVKEFPFNPLDDEIGKLKAENAKLRELVYKAWKAAEKLCNAFEGPCSGYCALHDPCPMGERDEECIYGQLEREMREAGIEVE